MASFIDPQLMPAPAQAGMEQAGISAGIANAIGQKSPGEVGALYRALSARGQVSNALTDLLRKRRVSPGAPDGAAYSQSIGLGVD